MKEESPAEFIARVEARLREQVGGPINGDPDYVPRRIDALRELDDLEE